MKIVIAHGSFGKPHENWIPWLEEKLDEKGVEYLTPVFPTPNHQNYSDWEKVLDLYKSFGCFNEDTIFIGHSCGAIFLAQYIVKKKFSCKAYISVAGYNEFKSGDALMDKLNGSFYIPPKELSRINKYAKTRIAFFSDNDPHIPQEKLKELPSIIEAEPIILKNGGHINKSAGYTTFRELIEIIDRIK